MDSSLKGQDFFGEIPYSEGTLKRHPEFPDTRSIPQTTINTIFSFLDPKSFFNLTRVNRFFNTEILENPEKLQREKLYRIEIEFRDEEFTEEKKLEIFRNLFKDRDPKIIENNIKGRWPHIDDDYELLILGYFSNENIMQARKYIIDKLINDDNCYDNSSKTVVNVFVKGDKKKKPVFEEFCCYDNENEGWANVDEYDYNGYYG